jgi:general secretion pathway protein A
MYAEYYGLTKQPFNLTPDPAFLFLTRQHREGLAGLAYAIQERKGFLVLTGIAGSGKTTLLAWLLQKLPPGRVKASVIFNPMLTRAEFLELVLLQFGVTEIPESKARRLEILRGLLEAGTAEGRVFVLIVDEAHKLDAELLEEVRLLGNFQDGKGAMLQILLIGQSELDETLAQPGLWQLKQRIAVRLAIQPLAAGEVLLYLQHRWQIAGGKLPLPIAAEAITAVGELSQGIPRLINSLCDNALMLAFAEDQREVTPAHVRSAAADLRLGPPPKPAPGGDPPPAAGVPLPVIPMFRLIGDSRRPEKPEPRKRSRMTQWAMKLGLV